MKKIKNSLPIVVIIALVGIAVMLSSLPAGRTSNHFHGRNTENKSIQRPAHSKEWYKARKVFTTFYNDSRGGTNYIATNMDNGNQITYTVMKHSSDNPYVFNTNGPSFYIIRATDSDGNYDYECVRLDGGGTTTGQESLDSYFALQRGAFSTTISPNDSAKQLDNKYKNVPTKAQKRAKERQIKREQSLARRAADVSEKIKSSTQALKYANTQEAGNPTFTKVTEKQPNYRNYWVVSTTNNSDEDNDVAYVFPNGCFVTSDGYVLLKPSDPLADAISKVPMPLNDESISDIYAHKDER